MTIKEIRWAVLGSAIAMLMCSPSFATMTVTDLQLDLHGGQFFFSPGTTFNGEFSFNQDYSAPEFSSMTIGQFQVAGDPTYLYEIRGGIITFSPSELLADESEAYSMPVGTFAKGGILTVEGSIVKVGATSEEDVQVLGYGIVLEAAIIRDFQAWGNAGENTIYAQTDMDITGGALAAGSGSGFTLYHEIKGDSSFYQCTQGGGDVVDFSHDINFSGLDSIVQINPIPEPMTVMLLGLGVLRLIKRR